MARDSGAGAYSNLGISVRAGVEWSAGLAGVRGVVFHLRFHLSRLLKRVPADSRPHVRRPAATLATAYRTAGSRARSGRSDLRCPGRYGAQGHGDRSARLASASVAAPRDRCRPTVAVVADPGASPGALGLVQLVNGVRVHGKGPFVPSVPVTLTTNGSAHAGHPAQGQGNSRKSRVK